jgi:hypothetical protein
MPVGMALGNRWDDHDWQLFKLTLKEGGAVPGLWVVIDREFIPVSEAQ